MNGFKVVCNECGSEDVAVYPTMHGDVIFECENCGQHNYEI